MKRLALVLALLLMFVTACGGNQNAESGKSSVEEGDSVIIGGLAPLTGSAAVYGNTAAQGAKLAFKEINEQGGILGKPVEFLLEDEKGEVTDAMNAYGKLLDDGMVVLLGDVTSQPTLAVAELALDDNLPMITPTGTQWDITVGKPNVFRSCFTDPLQGEVMAQFAKEELGAETVAIMSNNSSEYSQGVKDAFVDKANALGLEIVADEGYSSDDNDFRGQLTSIKSKNPDLLMVPDYYDIDALLVLQAKEVGLDCQIIGSDGWDGVVSQVTEDKYELLDGIIFASNYSMKDEKEIIQNFVKNYQAEYGEDPASFSANAYDAAYMIKEAIEKAGSLDADAIVEAMKGLEFEGVTGSLKFDENNNPIKEVTMIIIEDGEYNLHSVQSLK